MALAATYRTHIVVVILIVVVDVAIVEIDVPGVVGVVGISSAGPVVVGLDPAFLFIYLSAPRYTEGPSESDSTKLWIRIPAFSYHLGKMNAQ